MSDFLRTVVFLIGDATETLHIFCGLVLFRVVLGYFFPKFQNIGLFRRIFALSSVFLLIGLFISIAYYGNYWHEYHKYDLNKDDFVDEIEYLRVPDGLKNESGSVLLSLWLLVATWLIPTFVFFVEFASMAVTLFIRRFFERRHP